MPDDDETGAQARPLPLGPCLRLSDRFEIPELAWLELIIA
jgi:hypothetical protein